MNFFEHQEKARRKTWWLGVYFTVALVLIVAAVDMVIAIAFARVNPAAASTEAADLVPLLLGGALATLCIVGLGAAWKTFSLSSGGIAVAEMMGGERVSSDTNDPLQRRLVNIVEEMALASGIAVPAIYVLTNEASINAFAAGRTPSTAVVAVSHGALQTLNRDELQGVIAHEFSHIFNGDMRLNIRLIALLHGILVIAVVGRVLARGSTGGRIRTRNNRSGGGLALVGLALLAIGYIGVFFAQLIRSAISRQREFLADASAVQFTRNHVGILGALVKIRDGAGARLTSAHTDEVSHLLFAQGLSSLFATHPPLEQRIRVLDASCGVESTASSRSLSTPGSVSKPSTAVGFADTHGSVASAAVASVGQPKGHDLAAAADLLVGLGAELRSLLASARGARAVVYALVLASEADTRREQLARLGGEAALVDQALAHMQTLGLATRLPLVELAVTALRTMSGNEIEVFCTRVEELSLADGRLEPFELMLHLFLRHALLPELERRSAGYRTLPPALPAIALMLSLLAHAGRHRGVVETERAFRIGLAHFGGGVQARLSMMTEVSVATLRDTLVALRASSFQLRELVMGSAAACVLSDARVTIEEWELLRVFAAALECPLPLALAAPGRN